MAEQDNTIANLARSGRMRIAAALLVTALVGGGLGVIILRGDNAGNALLYSGLDLEEAAEIAGRLDGLYEGLKRPALHRYGETDNRRDELI